MPPQLLALVQNRTAQIVIAVVLVASIILAAVWLNQPKTEPPGGGPLDETQRTLATVNSAGRALEIQALLAREGIRLNSGEAGSGRYELSLTEEATKEEKDRALITLVQSGLMDRNIGLEAFDTGDLTASREEKRIKLVRAQQGELARLIRKISPIQDAAVSLSIPEPTLFKSEQKPMSASVQVTLNAGERLTRDKVRSIINLVVGAIQGLSAENVALSDTNGNVYNSVLGMSAQMEEKLEEQDAYMKQKVSAQLDKLIGNGHYVVTVSTQLREVTRETMTQNYDPAGTVVQSKQSFSEAMNPGGSGKAQGGAMGGVSGSPAAGPTSTMVPSGLTSWMAAGPPFSYPPPQHAYPEPPKTIHVPKNLVPYVQNRAVPLKQPTNQNPYNNYAQTTADVAANPSSKDVSTSATASGKGYERSGSEISYATGRTQTLETAMPGVVEDISVAVSIDRNHMPSMNPDELKGLIARAANPRVSPDSVSIVVTDFNQPRSMSSKNENASDKENAGSGAMDEANAPDLPPADKEGGGLSGWSNWLIWGGLTAVVLGVLAMVLMLSQSNKGEKQRLEQAQQELSQLREMALEQQQQIQAAQAQAQMAMQAQQTQQTSQAERQKTTQALKETLTELQHVFSQQDPAMLSQQVQHWMNNG